MDSKLLAWLRLSGWRMPVLRPYGIVHLLLLFVLTPLVVALAWRLRKCSEKTIRWILFGIGIALIVTEIYKQLFLTYVVEGTYCYADFPFQLCSMPMYLCPLLLVMKDQTKKVCDTFLATFNLLGGIVALLEPSASFYPYVTMTIHSVLWHQALIFIGCLLWFSGLCRWNPPVFRKAVFLYLLFCAIAYSLNAALMKPSEGAMNLYFIGPGPAPVIVLDWVSAHWGPLPETILMILVTILGSSILWTGFSGISEKKKKERQMV